MNMKLNSDGTTALVESTLEELWEVRDALNRTLPSDVVLSECFDLLGYIDVTERERPGQVQGELVFIINVLAAVEVIYFRIFLRLLTRKTEVPSFIEASYRAWASKNAGKSTAVNPREPIMLATLIQDADLVLKAMSTPIFHSEDGLVMTLRRYIKNLLRCHTRPTTSVSIEDENIVFVLRKSDSEDEVGLDIMKRYHTAIAESDFSSCDNQLSVDNMLLLNSQLQPFQRSEA